MKQAYLNCLASFVAGALIWALCPQPHDISYAAALLLSGLALGSLLPSAVWAHYPGFVLGQAMYFALFAQTRSGFLLLGGGAGLTLAYVAASSLIALAGAAAGAKFIRLLFRLP